MSLGQIGNTHPSLYAFLCEFDALKESFLPLIFLHDFSPNFGSLCPWLWWKFDSSVSEPGIFLSQLPYNERPQIQPRLEHPPSRCFQR
jgi:hypothetical protein